MISSHSDIIQLNIILKLIIFTIIVSQHQYQSSIMGLKLLLILQINSSYSSKKLLKSDGSVTWNNLHHNIFIISKFKKFLKTYLTSKYEQCLKISTAISILHRLVPYFINQENTVYLLFPFFLFLFFFFTCFIKN